MRSMNRYTADCKLPNYAGAPGDLKEWKQFAQVLHYTLLRPHMVETTDQAGK